MKHVLRLEVVWTDEHLIELSSSFVAGDWQGCARAYTTQSQLEQFAEQLAQFSRTLAGEAKLEAGNADTGIGYLHLHFYVIDAARHVACHVKLATTAATDHRPEEVAMVSLELRTEPAAMDRFIQELRRLASERTGEATLAIL